MTNLNIGLNRDFAFIKASMTAEQKAQMSRELARVHAERVAANSPGAKRAKIESEIAALREGLARYGADDADYARSVQEQIARREGMLND